MRIPQLLLLLLLPKNSCITSEPSEELVTLKNAHLMRELRGLKTTCKHLTSPCARVLLPVEAVVAIVVVVDVSVVDVVGIPRHPTFPFALHSVGRTRREVGTPGIDSFHHALDRFCTRERNDSRLQNLLRHVKFRGLILSSGLHLKVVVR